MKIQLQDVGIMRRLYCSLLLAVALLTGKDCLAQPDDQRLNYAGRDFWITTQYVTALGGDVICYIFGAENANITLTVNPTNNVQNYTHKGGAVTRIILDAAQRAAFATGSAIETAYTKSIHIESDTDVVVQFYIIGGSNDDGSLIVPSDKQIFGNEFYLNGPKIFANPVWAFGTANSGFSIVSRCDNTVLEITPSMNTFMNKPAGVPFQVTLSKGDTYVIAPDNQTDYPDLSGTKIRVVSSDCCNPINVFLTYYLTNMMWPPTPQGNMRPSCCADRLYEQLLPVNQGDTAYVTATFRNNPYVPMKIVSAGNNNQIRFDGVPIATLQAGQYLDTFIRDEVFVTSDSPISITQHMISQSETFPTGQPTPVDSFSDPASLLLLPVQYGVKDAYISPVVNTPRAFPTPMLPVNPIYTMSAITICSKTADVAAIQLNNMGIAPYF